VTGPLRVVLVMLEAPVPLGNAAARWYYVLLRELVARGHRVTALAACSKPTEMDEARRLFPAPEYDLRLYPFPARSGLRAKLDTARRPYSYVFSPDLRRDLEAELARGFDVLHLEQLWAGWVGLAHRDRAVVNVHYLFSIDLEDAPRPGWKYRVLWRLTQRAERRLLRHFPVVAALSPRLAARVREIAPAARVEVVPLGLDPALYPYTPDDRRPADPVVGVIGNMRWGPTRSAAVRLVARLWPGIKKRVPAARLQLVGWGARSALADYLALPDVTVLEDVPDARPYFEQTSVLVYAPGRGSGMKVKVLEALAHGVPVVTTADGVEGLPAVDGVHAGVCEDDAGLIDRAARVLTDPAAANRQRAAGRALLEAHCGPKPTVDAVERVYQMIRFGGPHGHAAPPSR
jgi:glycosyltransferase involved in cell wall biosynthesis